MPPPEPGVAVLPYGHPQGRALADTPLDDLTWPLGRPDRLARGHVRDMGASDHLLIFPRTLSHFQRRAGIAARISLMLVEPFAVHAKHVRLLRLTHRRFFRVFTYNEDLLARLPNAIFLPYGTTWIDNRDGPPPEKTAMISLIASTRAKAEGHRLRHDLVDWVRATGQPVEVMGRGYKPFGDKAEGLAPFRFSVVIENSRERNYFSEKLLDAIFCDCVPIYWGCPNLGDYFDTSGIIECATPDDIRAAIASVTQADFDTRIDALRAIRPAAETFAELEPRAARALLDSL